MKIYTLEIKQSPHVWELHCVFSSKENAEKYRDFLISINSLLSYEDIHIDYYLIDDVLREIK